MTDLVASDLCVGRGGLPVLTGLNFTLTPGHAVILRGPNGVGKTTLLRTLAGLQPPMAGQITGAGDRVAYGAHADGIKHALSVAENLQFWASVYRGASAASAMAAFNLTHLADRRAHDLSAGQKRRLGLARLLVTDRPVWLLDEPTVSLDTDHVKMFADQVRAHLAGGGAALLATHIDLGLDAQVLDVTPFRASLSASPVPTGFEEAFL